MHDQSQESPRKPRNWPSIMGSDEERASKGLNRLEDITRLISEWVWETDVDGRITYSSERVTEILGYSPMELMGKRFDDFGTFLNDEDVQINPDLRESFRELPFKTQSKDGVDTLLLISGVPLYDRKTWKFEGSCGTSRDITILHNEKELLRISQDDSEKANQAKSEFLSSMSHELRTPLNAILGFGQMLDFNPKEPLSKTQKGCVEHIMSGGQHLLNLINDVLDLAKIEAGKVDLSIVEVSVKDVLEECLSLVKTMAAENGIKHVIGEGFEARLKIRADQIRFKQSLLNLMSNAIKYNSENGLVTVDCRETPSGMLHISVADTGAGIPEDSHEALFMPFNRLDAENTDIEGTGIGLTITKQLIERMGGHIGVDSVVGEGSVFWIELPKAEVVLTQETSADGDTDGDVKLLPEVKGTVLYVEDNPANLELMEMIISQVEGLSMISAHNAELGINLAKSKRPGLIILDINLPDMNGYEALVKLQNLEETKDIPVIALSANAMSKNIEKGLQAGFIQYLTKPMQVNQVISVIKEILET